MSTLPKPNPILAYIAPFVIFLVCCALTSTASFKMHPSLMSVAILLDLVITAPVIYFLAIRKSRMSLITVSRVFIVGIFLAGWILNDHSNPLIHGMKTWVTPVLEIMTIGYIGRKFITAYRQAKLAENSSFDFLIYTRQVISNVIGNNKVGNIIASEFGVIYYAFSFANSKKENTSTTFTTYKNSGIILIVWTFIAIFLIETVGMHILVHLWNSTAAWILTALSAYSCLQLMAHIRAIKARPVQLSDNAVEVYNGLAGDAIIPYANCEKVEVSDKIPANREAVKLTLLNTLEKHNCIIYLKHPQAVTKVFGIQRTADTILCTIDLPSEFAAKVQARLAEEADKSTSY